MNILKFIHGKDLEKVIATFFIYKMDIIPRVGEQICLNELDKPYIVTNIMTDYRAWQTNFSNVTITVSVRKLGE